MFSRPFKVMMSFNEIMDNRWASDAMRPSTVFYELLYVRNIFCIVSFELI